MSREVKNYMEICVMDQLDTVLSAIEGCHCDKCRYDTMAIALNTLPSKYVATKKGEMYTKLAALQQQFEVDIIAAITKASEIVAKYPRHEEE